MNSEYALGWDRHFTLLNMIYCCIYSKTNEHNTVYDGIKRQFNYYFLKGGTQNYKVQKALFKQTENFSDLKIKKNNNF